MINVYQWFAEGEKSWKTKKCTLNSPNGRQIFAEEKSGTTANGSGKSITDGDVSSSALYRSKTNDICSKLGLSSSLRDQHQLMSSEMFFGVLSVKTKWMNGWVDEWTKITENLVKKLSKKKKKCY